MSVDVNFFSIRVTICESAYFTRSQIFLLIHSEKKNSFQIELNWTAIMSKVGSCWEAKLSLKDEILCIEATEFLFSFHIWWNLIVLTIIFLIVCLRTISTVSKNKKYIFYCNKKIWIYFFSYDIKMYIYIYIFIFITIIKYMWTKWQEK